MPELSRQMRGALVVAVLIVHAVILACLVTSVMPPPPVPAKPQVLMVTWLKADPVPAARPAAQPPAAVQAKPTPVPSVPARPWPVVVATKAPPSPMTAATTPPDKTVSPTTTTVPVTSAQAISPPAPATEAKAATLPSPPEASPPRELAMSSVAYASPLDRTYPVASMRLGEAGTVVLRVLVDVQGRAAEVHLARSSGFSRLDQAATKAMRDVRFKPYAEGGVPRPFWVNTPVTYDLGE